MRRGYLATPDSGSCRAARCRARGGGRPAGRSPGRVLGSAIVTPSSNIQKLIDSNPAGSKFCFQPGTYTSASQLEPQSNDVFDGDGQQAVLDGGKNYQFAFYGDANSTGPSGVTIQNFKDSELRHAAAAWRDPGLQRAELGHPGQRHRAQRCGGGRYRRRPLRC